MMLLPTVRSAYLKSFALVLGLGGGVLGALLAWCFDLPGAVLPILLLILSFLITAFVSPSLVSGPYRLWNLGVRQFARAARLILLGICFYIVFVVVGKAGTTIKLARPMPGHSLWATKKAIVLETFRHEFRATADAVKQRGWLRSYCYWAKSSGELWAVFLVPFLTLLAAIEVYTDRRFPDGVYTLF